MIKKIILLSLLPITIIMAGSFIMTEGKPLMKAEDSSSIAPGQTEPSTAGCTDSYSTTVNVSNVSALTSAVANANVSTKIIVNDGPYGSMTLTGNTAPVCIEAVNQNLAVIGGQLTLTSNNVTLSKLKFTGDNAELQVSGDDCRLTLCTFDAAGIPYYIKSTTAHRFEIDHNTFKNLRSGVSVASLFLSSYADDAEPAGHTIHHNYFVDMDPSTIIQPRLRISSTNDTGLGEDRGEAGWDFGRGEYKDDEVVISNNYFLRATKPLNGKMNGLIFKSNTLRDCPSRANFRAGKGGLLDRNYFINSNGFDLDDKDHIATNNYFDGANATGGTGAIQISNGGYNGSSSNFREAATNVSVTSNYFKDMERSIYFGLKIDSQGYDDLPPSGSTINNDMVNVTTAIHVNKSGDPLMQNMVTTPNNEYTTALDPGWDMSGLYDSTDVANGTVGAGI